MFITILAIQKHYLILIIIWGLSLFTVQCGAQPAAPIPEKPDSSDRITTEVRFESEPTPEIKLIATEQVPLNNCKGNSALKMDVERSREFIYAIINKNGYEFGGEYGFLTGLLEEEHSVVNGEKEIQTHTLHLETKANSHVIYTLAWKESWLNGSVLIRKNEAVNEVSYRIKKGLTLEVQTVEDVSCE